MATARVGDWEAKVSRSTGKRYYFNSSTGESAWHDDALPAGWAWAKSREDAPRYFINLLTNARQPQPPPPPLPQLQRESVQGEPSLEHGAAVKRPRLDGSAALDAVATTAAPIPRTTGAGGGSASPASPAAIKPPPPPSVPFPVLSEAAFTMGKPPERPAGDRRVDYSMFQEPHKLVLRQLLAALKAQAQARERDDSARGGGHAGAGERMMVCFDVGAGTGAATEYMVQQLGAAPAPPLWEVYGVDLWELGTDYYAQSLRQCGATELAARFAAPAAPTFEQFCVNFWEDENVTPARYPDDFFIRKIQYFGVVPSLVYIDCDLHADRVRRLLHAMFEPPSGWGASPHPPVIAGGGWAVSPGVRAAVEDFAREQRMRLHVEQGQAWTLSGHLIRESHNASYVGGGGATAAAGSHVSDLDAAAAEALRVAADEGSLRQERRMAWLGRVFAVIEQEGDVAALRAVMGRHGRAVATTAPGTIAAAGMGMTSDPGSGAPPSGEEVWIDSGGDDKRHLTPLIRAAQAGRADLVAALIDEFGADVNAQAERSKYTALLGAAFDGHEATVAALLARGANPLLTNKFGESVIAAVRAKRGGCSERVLALLQAAATAAAAAPSSSSPSMRGVAVAIAET